MEPIIDCLFVHPDDSTCTHIKAMTPECHVDACPRLAPFVADLLAACVAHQEAVHYQTLCITGQFTDENYAKWDEALDRAHKARLFALAKAKGE